MSMTMKAKDINIAIRKYANNQRDQRNDKRNYQRDQRDQYNNEKNYQKTLKDQLTLLRCTKVLINKTISDTYNTVVSDKTISNTDTSIYDIPCDVIGLILNKAKISAHEISILRVNLSILKHVEPIQIELHQSAIAKGLSKLFLLDLPFIYKEHCFISFNINHDRFKIIITDDYIDIQFNLNKSDLYLKKIRIEKYDSNGSRTNISTIAYKNLFMRIASVMQEIDIITSENISCYTIINSDNTQLCNKNPHIYSKKINNILKNMGIVYK